jgi:hypothetical protein
VTNEQAWRVVQVAFRGAAELQELIGFLKQNCTGDEYKRYSTGIAAAIDAINVHLLNGVLSDHPQPSGQDRVRSCKVRQVDLRLVAPLARPAFVEWRDDREFQRTDTVPPELIQ